MARTKNTDKEKSTYKDIPKPIGEGVLKIGELKIPCAVLPGGVRVLSQRGALSTIGFTSGGAKAIKDNVRELPRFLRSANLKPFISEELLKSTNFIKYWSRGGLVRGFRAESLPMACEVYLEALAAGALKPNQLAIAGRCRILQNGFARVGIIALVDEATGYEEKRAKRALAEILEKFLAEKVHEWTKTFPLDFYRQIYRLKGWNWHELESGKKPKTPILVGQYTVDLIYKRIAPGVLDELKKRKQKREQNQESSVRYHQWFNEESGHPKLKEHIAGVMALMRVSYDWPDFMSKVDMAFPVRTNQGALFSRSSDKKGDKHS